MSHNIPLPAHRYVYVMSDYVQSTDRGESPYEYLPAVWWGISLTPNRTLGCHVVLDNGAMVVDLPVAALRWHNTLPKDGKLPLDASWITWDAYGWEAEIVQSEYLDGLRVQVLNEDHQPTGEYGQLWFAVDHVRDGFSKEPAQHKHLWVIAMQCGRFAWVPQDQLLVYDKSFTEINGVPRIKRQARIWSYE